jgi:hypothetical protein
VPDAERGFAVIASDVEVETAGSAEPLASGFRHPWTAAAVVGVLAIAIRLAMVPLIPVPVPLFHDEFSYLLGADTFASGRITNPPHPLWVHFETFHVNQLPTYCSKYLPGQALFLAFGQRILGHPWFGVCVSMGLMFGCICWMLLGWVSPWAAVMTSALAVMGWGFTGQWINSYWGGALTAAGGALLTGAIARFAARPAASTALPGVLGLVLMGYTPPFEGTLAAGSAAVVLVWMARRSGKRPRALFARGTIAVALIGFGAGIAGLAYYNYRTTGHPTVAAYLVNSDTYAAAPNIYLQPLPAVVPVYRHDHMRRFWLDWDKGSYLAARANPLVAIGTSLDIVGRFYFWTPVGLAMLNRDHVR